MKGRSFEIAVLAMALGLVSLGLGQAASKPDHRVLFLGDSLSMGAFGRTLDMSLRENAVEVYTHVAGGASPYYWLRRYEPISCSIGYWEKTPANERRVGYIRAVPKVEDLIDTYTPDVVVVQTGVNLYATLRSKRRTHDENVEVVEELISDMCRAVHRSGAYSYWITPPESHPKRYSSDLQGELAKIMKRVVGEFGGSVFESAKVTTWKTPYPSQSDGIHYGPLEAKEWAQSVASDFSKYIGGIQKRPTPVLAPVRAVPISLKRPEPEPTVVEPATEVATPVNLTPEPQPEPEPKPTPAPIAEEPKVVKTEDTPPVEPAAADPPAEPKTIGAPRPEVAEASEEISVKIKLKQKSAVNSLNEVSYNNAFGLYEYEVEEVEKGEYPFDTVRVAHMVVLHKKFTGATKFEVGKTYYLTLVKQSKYPRLQRVQLVDDLPMELDLPIYICKF